MTRKDFTRTLAHWCFIRSKTAASSSFCRFYSSKVHHHLIEQGSHEEAISILTRKYTRYCKKGSWRRWAWTTNEDARQWEVLCFHIHDARGRGRWCCMGRGLSCRRRRWIWVYGCRRSIKGKLPINFLHKFLDRREFEEPQQHIGIAHHEK